MMGVSVVGGSKTGTTGLFASVRAGLLGAEGACYGINERYDRAVFDNLRRLAPDVPVVAKLLVTNGSFSPDLADRFDKRLFIVRDPRDTLVSVALYYPVRAVNMGVPESSISDYVELVARKERDPGSVSFREMLTAVYALVGRRVDESTSFARRFGLAMDYVRSASPFLVRYESMIEGRLDDAAAYLGFPLAGARPTDYASTVLRSGSAGEWRHWFTDADVDHFRPMVAGYMSQFGYEADWELAPDPVLPPAHGTEYISAACEKRRRQRAILKAPEDYGEETLKQLRDRAGDGADSAAYQLARLLWEVDPAQHGVEIHDRARFAAACGNTQAMRLLARCLIEGVGTAPDLPEAQFWREEADAEAERQLLRRRVDELAGKHERHRRRLARTEGRLQEVTAQLEKVRGSRRYRAASLVANAVNDGPVGLLRLPGRLWKLRNGPGRR